jgi:hypothetical protein
MTKKQDQEEIDRFHDQLEEMIDKTSLGHVLWSLRTIVDEKATHIGENWQDHKLATTWRKMESVLEKAAIKAEEQGLGE